MIDCQSYREGRGLELGGMVGMDDSNMDDTKCLHTHSRKPNVALQAHTNHQSHISGKFNLCPIYTQSTLNICIHYRPPRKYIYKDAFLGQDGETYLQLLQLKLPQILLFAHPPLSVQSERTIMERLTPGGSLGAKHPRGKYPAIWILDCTSWFTRVKARKKKMSFQTIHAW